MPVVISLLNAFTRRGPQPPASRSTTSPDRRRNAGWLLRNDPHDGEHGDEPLDRKPAVRRVRGRPSAGRQEERQSLNRRPDAAIKLAYADSVVFVPGYGMAVAQAQHAVKGSPASSRNVGRVSYAIIRWRAHAAQGT
jgi:hypothetical protein